MKDSKRLITTWCLIITGCLLLSDDKTSAAQAPTTKSVVIYHFGDLAPSESSSFFSRLVERYKNRPLLWEWPLIVGSGDYVTLPNQLPKFKSTLAGFLRTIGCSESRVLLAPGNHDDPGRATNNWLRVWAEERPAEGVVRRGDLLIGWMHAEKPNLEYLTQSFQAARQSCPNCVAILVGHKPLVLEPGYSAYQRFLLPEPWRTKTFSLMRQMNIQLYLTGHFEIHGIIRKDGVIHNRVTPARRGYEEINIEYYPITGEVKNITINTKS